MLFLRLGKGLKTVLGSTHVVEQLPFSMFPSILTSDFYLILDSYFTFWDPNGLFLGFGKSSKTHVVEQLSFSMFPPILTFDFDLILGSFLTFWGPNRLILGLV